MCTEARVIKNGEATYCETVGQLADALGVKVSELPVWESEVFVAEADDCLCSVQWDKLPARRATDTEGWPFPEYILEPPNASGEPGLTEPGKD